MIEYGPLDYRNGILFGNGGYFHKEGTPTPEDPETLEREVKLLGWAHGCPIVNEVVDTYGPEYAFNRYSNCNREFVDTIKTLKGVDWPLAGRLMQPISRTNPVGKFEQESVPPSHQDEIAPMITPVGYAFPRVRLLNQDSLQQLRLNPPDIRIAQRMNLAEAVRHTEVPEYFLMNLAEITHRRIQNDQTKVIELFGHLFPTGLLEEENCIGEYEHLANVMDQIAPNLRNDYLALSKDPAKLTEAGVILLR